jgi:periplasmic protein TonB
VGSVAGEFFMSAHIQQANLLSGRSLVMAVTIALHALVISALMASRMGVVPTPPVKEWMEAVQPDKPAEPVIEVDITSPKYVVASHVTNLVIPVPAAIEFPEDVVIDPMLPRLTETVLTSGRPDPVVAAIPETPLQYQATRSTAEYYPPASIRLEEQGIAVVQICVANTGRVQGRPQITASSGYARLDAAAVRWAQEALRFTAATRDGVAVGSCKGFKVIFDLH